MQYPSEANIIQDVANEILSLQIAIVVNVETFGVVDTISIKINLKKILIFHLEH